MLEHGPAVRDCHADAIPAAVENVVEKAASNEVTSQQDIVETERVERIREAYAAYREMSVEEHKSRGDQFREATTVTGFKMEIKRHGLAKSQALRAAFAEWLAGELWGPASASAPAGTDNGSGE